MKTLLSLIFCAFFIAGAAELQERSFFDESVALSVPLTLEEVSNEEISQLFSQLSQPEIVLADKDRAVKVTLTRKHLGSKVVDQGSLDDLLPILVRNIERMSAVEIHKNKVQKVNHRQVGIVNYTQTDSLGVGTRHLTFFSDLEGQLFLGSFICPEKEFDSWKKPADTMIKSLSIK